MTNKDENMAQGTDDVVDFTEEPTPTTAPDTPQKAAKAEPVTERQEAEGPEEGKAAREAAKYRRRLRDAEAERDDMAAQLDAARRSIAEGVAARHLAKPASLWLSGATPADVLDDNGGVDAEKVVALAQSVSADYGLSRPHVRPHSPREGTIPETPETGTSMRDVVMGTNR